jgi:hypothetical protein
MDRINLQDKTKAEVGKIEKYWFENLRIGLQKTLFHRIVIPLSPFDSGLSYVAQPEKTELVFEWYNLSLSDPNVLNALDLSHSNYPDAESSVYIGSAHNLCNVKSLKLSKIKGQRYRIVGELDIDFETEGVAQNESFHFDTVAEFDFNE